MIFCPFPWKPRSPTWINWVHPWRDSVNLLVLTLLGTILIPSLAMGVLLSGMKSCPWDPRSPTLFMGPTTLHTRPWGCCCQDTSCTRHQGKRTSWNSRLAAGTKRVRHPLIITRPGELHHVLNVKRVRFSTFVFGKSLKLKQRKVNITSYKLNNALPCCLFSSLGKDGGGESSDVERRLNLWADSS